MTFDPTTAGTIIVGFLGLAALLVLIWPQREPGPATPDAATLLEAERARMQDAAIRIADAEGLPVSMTAPLLDLADRLALMVHDGRRSPSSAMHYMTATTRKWKRALREAGAA